MLLCARLDDKHVESAASQKRRRQADPPPLHEIPGASYNLPGRYHRKTRCIPFCVLLDDILGVSYHVTPDKTMLPYWSQRKRWRGVHIVSVDAFGADVFLHASPAPKRMPGADVGWCVSVCCVWRALVSDGAGRRDMPCASKRFEGDSDSNQTKVQQSSPHHV